MKGEVRCKRRLDDSGPEVVWVDAPVYLIDGREVTEEEYRRHFPENSELPQNLFFGNHPGAWPVLSDALGVLPRQIDEARQSAARRGVPTDFSPDGRAIFRSRGHRSAYCKAYGFHDRDGGYGDAAPGPSVHLPPPPVPTDYI